MADEPEVKFRVPDPPTVIVGVGPRIITDPEELKILVEPSHEDVKEFGGPVLPPFAAIQKLRELCLAADEYYRDTGSKELLLALQGALYFAEKLEPKEEP